MQQDEWTDDHCQDVAAPGQVLLANQVLAQDVTHVRLSRDKILMLVIGEQILMRVRVQFKQIGSVWRELNITELKKCIAEAGVGWSFICQWWCIGVGTKDVENPLVDHGLMFDQCQEYSQHHPWPGQCIVVVMVHIVMHQDQGWCLSLLNALWYCFLHSSHQQHQLWNSIAEMTV